MPEVRTSIGRRKTHHGLAACAVGAVALLALGCQAGGNNHQYRNCEQGEAAEVVFVKGGSGGGGARGGSFGGSRGGGFGGSKSGGSKPGISKAPKHRSHGTPAPIAGADDC